MKKTLFTLITILLLTSCTTTQPKPNTASKQYSSIGVLIYESTKQFEKFYDKDGRLIMKHDKQSGKRFIYRGGKVVRVVL